MSFEPECYVVLNLVMQKILDTCWEYLQAQDGDNDFRVFYLNYYYVLILTSFYF